MGIPRRARIQLGTPFNIGQRPSRRHVTCNDLQKEVKMRFNDAAKIAYFLPQDIIDTIKALSTSAPQPLTAMAPWAPAAVTCSSQRRQLHQPSRPVVMTNLVPTVRNLLAMT
ncbi:MAG: hypothetical protein IPJ07_20415 [Acidobacteria bacterium]|nr:hypothetical protein [Acidobacteriota bacterium]